MITRGPHRPVSWTRPAFQPSTSRVQKQREGIIMEIKRSGSQPSNKGPADWFTGTVRIDPLFQAPDPARVAGASVTFEPGARTALACTSVRPDVDRHLRLRVGAAL